MSVSISADMQYLREGIDYIQSSLQKYNIKSKDLYKALLIGEELLVKCINSSPSDNKINIDVRRSFFKIVIRIKCQSERIIIEPSNMGLNFLSNNISPDVEEVIRNMLLNSYGQNISHKYKYGINDIEISVDLDTLNPIAKMGFSAVAGILFGLLLKVLPDAHANFINQNILTLFSELFINTLKMLVIPLVFFSIATTISQANDLRVLGRLGVKVFSLYIVTSVLAIICGYLIYHLVPISSPSAAAIYSNQISDISGGGVFFRETLLGLIPDNFFAAFTTGSMLQILFIAVILGIAAIRIKDSDRIKTFLKSGNDLFNEAIKIVLSFIGVSIFCSLASTAYSFGANSLTSFAGLWTEIVVADILMTLIVYSLLLIVLGGTNPLVFFKKMMPTMLIASTIPSSNAMVPNMMNACKNMGLSERIYAFSIPLGANINMDAVCIFQTITLFFMINSFGISLAPSTLIFILFMILFLSVGSPGVAGGSLATLAIILPMAGIPANAVNMITVVYSLILFIQIPCNIMGDATVTTIVDYQEKKRALG